LTLSSLKLSENSPLPMISVFLECSKNLTRLVKTLENIIEMKDKEKEIIIWNYKDLTEMIRGNLEMIRNV